jgi:hypothetical protein
MTAGATYGQAGALSFGAFEFAPAGLTGTGQAVAAAAGGFAAGGVAGGNLRSAVAGAVGALAMSVGLSYFNLPHGSPFTAGEFVGKVAIHGAVGCVRSAMAGGSCGGGAKSGAFAEFAGNLIGEYGAGLRTGSPAHMIAQVAAGCAGGAISGGRCSDGAFTAAFNYLFNECGHVQGGCWNALKDAASMSIDWATGRGATHRVFGPGSIQVTDMMDAPGVNATQDFYHNKYPTADPNGSVTNYRASFGVTGFFDNDGLLRTLSPTRQFVGSYSVDIFTVNEGKDLMFVLNNNSSFKSFAYGVGPAYERSTFAPAGNMRQTYWWTESRR